MTYVPTQLKFSMFRFILLKSKSKHPIENNWQDKNNYGFDNPKLLKHLSSGGNYGIIGGFGNLILVDGDKPEIAKICETELPETFTIKTGSKEEYKKHYYFFVDEKIKPIRLSKEKIGDIGDIRSVGQYVVAPNSIHPSGNKYSIIKDIEIASVTKKRIREVFEKYIDKTDSTEFKDFKISTTKRSSKFIRNCLVPDYVLNNKLKGETSKNWKLFPFIVDILYNREVLPSVYVALASKQEHKLSAIKGWVQYAREGKLAKTSCEKVKNYLRRFHPELIKELCEKCNLYKKENLTDLQKEVITALITKDRSHATELIVNKIKEDNYIFTTRDDIKSEMWLYKEGIYIPQGKSFIREFCRKILEKAFTTQISNEVIAKIEADTFIEHDKFFKTNYIDEIPLENGILNIFTRELNPFNPKKIFFNKLPIKYNPKSTCPNILEHFNMILKEQDDSIVLIELIGFCLLKEYKIEKAFMFVGKGRNGKSKTLELIKRFLGAENCSNLPLFVMKHDSFSLSEVFGKMANLAGDLSSSDLKETGTIKSMIGRDTIQAKRKFLRDLIFVNHAKLVFAANELPRVYDTTDGFWTKWVLLEFPYKFIPKKEFEKLSEEEKKDKRIMNPDIIKNLTTEEELSGLLNLSLDGLDRLIKNQDFSYSKGTNEVKMLWVRQSDSFTSFCIDCVEEDPEERITKKELRQQYHKYCKSHKIKGSSDKAIKITLQSNYGVEEGRKNVMGEFVHVWEGIKFKEMDKEKLFIREEHV